MQSIQNSLENAASMLDASQFRVLRDLTGPLIHHSLLAGWILVFIPSLKEVSASVVLYPFTTMVISTAILDTYFLPHWEAVATLSVLLRVINAVVSVVGYRFLGRNI